MNGRVRSRLQRPSRPSRAAAALCSWAKGAWLFTAQCLPSSCRARRECAAPSTMAPAARPGAAGAHVVQQWGGSSGSDMGSMLGYQRSTPSAMPCQPAQSLCCLHDASCCCSVRSSSGVPLMHSLHPTPYPTRPPNHPVQPRLRVPWQPALSKEERLRGLSYYGSGLRLQRVAAKLLAGQPIKVVMLGGSVTGGGGASAPDLAYAARFFQFVNTSFPHRCGAVASLC